MDNNLTYRKQRDEIVALLHQLPGLATKDFDEISSSGDGPRGEFCTACIDCEQTENVQIGRNHTVV
jgi:hypothetical protein